MTNEQQELAGARELAVVLCETSHDLTVPGCKVQSYLDSARARNTIRGYASDWKQFQRWCAWRGLNPLPASPEAIALYISENAGRLKAATLQHHLAAITKAHRAAGLPNPTQDNMLVSETLKGVKRVHGSAIVQKRPVLTEDLRMMLRMLPKNTIGIRDRALLLTGFAGAFRRSELVALDVADIQFTAEGLLITLRRSKTDQEGEGRQIAIPHGTHEETCAVRALQAWIASSATIEGPIFRPVDRHGRVGAGRLSAAAVALVVKRHAEASGLKPEFFAGHSLRAGFVTSAARAGEPERRIMRQTGHKSVEMVLRYVRQANIFADNAALALGL